MPRIRTTPHGAAVTIITGFAAIGAGGVILLGALLPLLSGVPSAGFTQPVETLRAPMRNAPERGASALVRYNKSSHS